MRKLVTALAGTSIISIMAMTPAAAQSGAQAADTPASAQPPSEETEEAIVITGTQVRGVKPVGSNVLTQDRKEIQATGVVDTNQVLAQLPQSNFFLDLPEPGGGNIGQGTPRVPLQRPNLRNIPGNTTSSGQQTLVLVDGHRIVPAGIEQAVVDAGTVPPGILERVEVILDGTSAVYGSDAVGGVINFITRKRFNGIEGSARYGIGRDYDQVDAAVTAGTTWGSGGIAFNYEFAKQSNILNRDRPDQAPLNWLPFNAGPPVSGSLAGAMQVDDLACPTPNITAGTVHTHVVGATLGPIAGTNADGGNYQFCAANDFETFTPAQERHSGFLTFAQDITSGVTFDLTAFYSDRKQVANSGPFTGSVTVRPTHPFYRPIPGFVGPAPNQTVAFSFGPLLGNESQTSTTRTEVAQVTPALTFDLGGDWQLRTLFAYGKSQTSVDQPRLDTLRLGSYFAVGVTAANTIDPYNIANTPNQNLVSALIWQNHVDGRHTFMDARAIVDGPLFTLPGGEVRAAVGVEWTDHKFKRRGSNPTTFILEPYTATAGNRAKSVFAEIVVPVIGPDNSGTFHSLTFAGSARYDDYGQYGDTLNPKFGFTFEPVDWITLRGNIGTLFRAPNAVDQLASLPTPGGALIRCLGQIGCAAGTNIPTPTGVASFNQPAGTHTNVGLFLTGALPNLKPETSTNWSIGADVRPPFIPGLTLSASYYHIKFKNFISTGNLGIDVTTIRRDFPEAFPICVAPFNECGGTVIADFLALSSTGPSVASFIAAGNGVVPYTVVALIDSRTRNVGGALITGLDASARYRHETGFGSVDASVNATWTIKNDLQFVPGGPIIDQLRINVPTFRMTATLGANIGDFRAQGTLRHTDGYDVDPSAQRLASQTHIRSFRVVDLAFVWDVNGEGPLASDLQLSLNVNNVLNSHPPFAKTTTGGTVGGLATLGRVFIFGIRKKFGGDGE